MAIVKPFKGLRPPKEIVKQLASRPYDVLNSEEARVEAAGNQYSLLHVTKAEIDLPAGTDEHSQAVYDKVVENFNAFKKNGWLVKEDKDACGKVINNALRIVQALSILSWPYVPAAAEKVWGFLGNEGTIEEAGINFVLNGVKTGQQLNESVPVFKKLDIPELKEAKQDQKKEQQQQPANFTGPTCAQQLWCPGQPCLPPAAGGHYRLRND